MRQTANEYFKKHKFYVMVWLTFTFGVAFFAPLKSFQLKWLIDAQSEQEALKWIILVFVITIVSFLLETTCRRIYTHMACEAVDEMRKSIMKSTLNRRYIEYREEKDAAYISLLTTDCRILYDDYYMSLFELVFWGGIMLVALLMFVYLNPILLLVTIMVSVPPIVFPRFMNTTLRNSRSAFWAEMEQYTNHIKELLSGFEVIRNFLYIEVYLQKHRKSSEKVRGYEEKYQQNLNTVVMSTSLMSNLIFAIMLLVGIFMVYNGNITLGTMTTATSLVNFVISPCHRIIQAYAKLKATKSIREKFEFILNRETEEISGAGTCTEAIGGLYCKDLCFAYPNHSSATLNGIRFSLNPNEKIAVVGESGCGKSTFAKILYQYDTTYSGSIWFGKRELREMDPVFLYTKVGYMAQDTYLFNDTIRNNICLYTQYDDAELEAALLVAGLKEFLDTLPEGLDAIVGENGNLISGGQRQRIGIARLVIRKYELIIADEITANLDVETTEQVMSNLLKLPCSMIVITHNTSGKFMKQFHAVYKMEQGHMIRKA